MRYLFLLRGAPASGKSTWIEENNLQPYTLSTDMIRLLYQSPVTTLEGDVAISQDNDTEVWKLLMQLLERRMDKGELVIIDATHYKAPLLNKYKDLVDKYRYRVYVVDFSDIPLEELLKRNAARDKYKRVPESVIQKMVYSLNDSSEVKKSYEILNPNTASQMLSYGAPMQSIKVEKDKVVIFGDIHGCYEPIKTYFENNPFDDNTCYIFVGDYIDRGLQNKEVLEFLLTIYSKSNVILLEGNHERWLREWCSKDYDEKQYEEESNEYKDYKITKFIKQLKSFMGSKIKERNILQNESKELSNKLREARTQDPNTCEIWHNFEYLNVPQRQQQINNQTKQLDSQIEKLTQFIAILSHEMNNSTQTVQQIMEYCNELGVIISIRTANEIVKKYTNTDIKTLKSNPIKSKEFLENTVQQIKDMDKAKLRQLCRKFAQCSYFHFGPYLYLVTHAGVPCIPNKFTQTQELIKGIGRYEDIDTIDETFHKNVPHCYSIHGHRNPFNSPAHIEGRNTFNLNSEVEFGQPFRVLELYPDGTQKVLEIPNTVYVTKDTTQDVEVPVKTDKQKIIELMNSKLITTKHLQDNVISLNFTRDAFYDRKWNEQTCTARGLFVDEHTGEVVARSYPKFFNWGELDSVKSESLSKTLQFPVYAFRKENGFLALISKYKGNIHFFTKSSNQGDFVNWFIGILCDKYNIFVPYNGETFTYSYIYNLVEKAKAKLLKEPILSETHTNTTIYLINELQNCRNKLKQHLNEYIEEGKTYIFECVDMQNDAHIIEYPQSDIFLLDIVHNNLSDEFESFKDVMEVSNKLGVPHKQCEYVFNSWDELYKWRQNHKNSYEIKHEGWVLEDTNNFRVKMKTRHYSFWKTMRKVKEKLQSGRNIDKIYSTKEEIKTVKLLQAISREELCKLHIIDIKHIMGMDCENEIDYSKVPELLEEYVYKNKCIIKV